MNRRHHSGGTHNPSACQGRMFGRVSIRWVMVIAIVLAGWGLFMAEWLNSVPNNNLGGESMVEEMVWNPSPM
ncbi:MAG: hypothetical protein P4L87_12635 [Formivibrio sp.]|nr:hypothetical protein [Formivibrio sp.]